MFNEIFFCQQSPVDELILVPYFIKTNEKNPQYIYAIEDNDIGEKVGEMKGKKKIFYKKK